MIDSRNRVFHRAVLASLVLHALVLFAFPSLVDPARRAGSIRPQIMARLMEPEPAPALLPQSAPKSSVLPKPKIAARKPASAVEAPAPHAETPAESLSRDQYRLRLLDEARRHKRYPPLARENSWQGDVRVGVMIGADGRASVALKGGSGYEVLDRQALEMFAQAARSVPVPPALRGKDIELRAIYGLED